MVQGRNQQTATLMSNGEVLVRLLGVGGFVADLTVTIPVASWNQAVQIEVAVNESITPPSTDQLSFAYLPHHLDRIQGPLILNGGVCDGKRLLSEEAVRQLTSRQTAPGIKESYGLGFSVGADGCGHGGAYATNMQIDRKRGLVLVWMVQHNGFPRNGAKSQDAFKQAAIAAFAP